MRGLGTAAMISALFLFVMVSVIAWCEFREGVHLRRQGRVVGADWSIFIRWGYAAEDRRLRRSR